MNDLSTDELIDVYQALMVASCNYSEMSIYPEKCKRYQAIATKIWPVIRQQAQEQGIIRLEFSKW